MVSLRLWIEKDRWKHRSQSVIASSSSIGSSSTNCFVVVVVLKRRINTTFYGMEHGKGDDMKKKRLKYSKQKESLGQRKGVYTPIQMFEYGDLTCCVFLF